MRLEQRTNGHCDVYDADNNLVGVNIPPDLADRWLAVLAARRLVKLHARVAPNIALQVTANAAKYGVTVSTYVAEVLRQHVAGDELSFAARATGLAAAGEDTRSLVAKAGVAGRERKSTARKLAAPRRRK